MYPYTTNSLNTQEIVNEIMVLVTLYSLFLYTDFVPNAAIRYNIGWGHIGMLLLNVIFNVGYMIRVLSRTVKLRCMKYSFDKQVKLMKKNALKKAEDYKRAEDERRSKFMALFGDMGPVYIEQDRPDKDDSSAPLAVIPEEEDPSKEEEFVISSESSYGSNESIDVTPDVVPSLVGVKTKSFTKEQMKQA